MASTVASIIFESCTFAALTRTASGMPWASTTRWRSALFAAIRWVLARFLPPPEPAPRRSPARPGPSRCDRPGPALREAPGAACARRPLGTSLAACASMSSRSHTPSRQASTPRGCPSSARIGSPSAPPGPTPGAVRPWASAAPAGAAARSAPRTHQATAPSPWHPPPWLLFCFLGCLRDGFVRRTKYPKVSPGRSVTAEAHSRNSRGPFLGAVSNKGGIDAAVQRIQKSQSIIKQRNAHHGILSSLTEREGPEKDEDDWRTPETWQHCRESIIELISKKTRVGNSRLFFQKGHPEKLNQTFRDHTRDHTKEKRAIA